MLVDSFLLRTIQKEFGADAKFCRQFSKCGLPLSCVCNMILADRVLGAPRSVSASIKAESLPPSKSLRQKRRNRPFKNECNKPQK